MLKGVVRIVERESTRNVLRRLVKLLEQNKLNKISNTSTIFTTIFTAGNALGAYCGLYVAQNYNVPFVDSPVEMIDKFHQYLETFKKERQKEPSK